MEVVQVLHMVGGVGETSYASNSSLQRKAIAKAKPMVEQTMEDVYCSVLPGRMSIVDLGCSSGPNALLVAGEILSVIGKICHRVGRVQPEIQYFLNDLPANDFNTLLRDFVSFKEKLKEEKEEGAVPFYVSCVPGSFYSRLFPEDSVHFVHSSYCLHFLSQVPRGVESNSGVPLNKQNIYLSRTSPSIVFQLYQEQFQRDFTLFLKLRSKEIITGGCMVLVFLGRGNPDPLSGECSLSLKLLADALTDMASEGLIEEDKVGSFNLPFYAPSIEELKAVIHSEGSFDIIQSQVFELNWDPTDDCFEDFVADKITSGENVSKCIRAVLESLLIDHFGEVIIDDLFSRYAMNVATHLSKEKTKYANLSISLKNKAKRKV